MLFQRLSKGDGVLIAFMSEFLKLWPAATKAKSSGGFVKRFTNGVINSGAKDAVLTERTCHEHLVVPAAHKKRKERERKGLEGAGNEGVGFHVMDADNRERVVVGELERV
jgi:hypothetical protein